MKNNARKKGKQNVLGFEESESEYNKLEWEVS